MKNYLKLLTTLGFVLLLTGVISSCHKTEYNPKKKIANIYQSVATNEDGIITQLSPKTLVEEWVWDKGKLTAIKVPSFIEGIPGYTLNFVYTNKLLTEVRAYSGLYQYKIEYQNNMMSKITVTVLGQIAETIEVKEVSKKKITKLHIVLNLNTIFGEKSKEFNAITMTVSNLLFSPSVSNTINRTAEKLREKSGEAKIDQSIVDMAFTYSGENISTITQIDNYSNGPVISHYQYDTKNNPFYHLYVSSGGSMVGTTSFSENNPTQYRFDEDLQWEKYEYKYEDNWPIERITNEIPTWYPFGKSTDDYDFITTTYFEYVK